LCEHQAPKPHTQLQKQQPSTIKAISHANFMRSVHDHVLSLALYLR
jgi:hypothetical protein